MPSKAKKLSSLFDTVVKLKNATSSPSSSAAILTSSTTSKPKSPTFLSKKASQRSAGLVKLPTLMSELKSDSEDSANSLAEKISSVMCCDNSIDSPNMPEIDNERSMEKELIVPWFPDVSSRSVSLRRKEVFRERRQKWIFKNSHDIRFGRLVDTCAKNIGTDATFAVLGKIGRQTGVKEYNALINICIEKARSSVDEEIALEQFHKALRLFDSMKEQGFSLEEETYGPFLAYLIDKGMVEEFNFIIGVVKGENHNSISRLGYYEMLLWIKVNNEVKIRELCDWMVTDQGENKSSLQENYLLALSECDRTREVSQLLEIIDITKLPSMDSIARLFEFFGKQLLESLAKKLLVAFKASDLEAENITNFIYSYAVGIPNLAVEDAISKFKDLHAKLELTLSCASYHKLVTYCCDSCKVHLALDLVNELCEMGFTLSTETLHTILLAAETNIDFILVRQIFAMIGHHNLKLDEEAFRVMINLSVRMKDFAGAYNLLNDLKKLNIRPTASMYNAIMGGYFREKNFRAGFNLLKQMERADVKPDSTTFSYLIHNSQTEEDINTYYEELKLYGVQVTKHIYMSLVNAYAACGQYKKAKQVVLDNLIPVKSLNEIKSVLVQSLASHGQLSDALSVYKEIKQAGYSLEPKAVISLIEHLDYEENVSTFFQLLGELEDLDYWIDGCCRVISCCVRYKHLSSAIDLLKQINEKVDGNEYAMEAILNEVFSLFGDLESSHLQIGMDLLEFVKNVCNLTPSRKCLDFLLHACINAKDLENGKLIWKEYEAAGFPYNVSSFLRMYQVLLAAGDDKAAKSLLAKIPKDDPHVRCIIKASQTAYIDSTETTMTRKGRIKKRDKQDLCSTYYEIRESFR